MQFISLVIFELSSNNVIVQYSGVVKDVSEKRRRLQTAGFSFA
jgi:hypothetical protein